MMLVNSIDTYLDWKRTHAKFAPDRYAIRLSQLLNFLGRKTVLSDITGDDIIRYHRFLESQTIKTGEANHKYSLATVAYSVRILKNFFMFWQGRGESKVNHKEILAIRYAKPIKKTVTLEEFKEMSNSLDERFFDDLIKKLVIHLLWDTGMRISELCELDISNINNVNAKHGLRTATVRTRKTMQYNLVVWGNETNNLLNRYLGLRLCCDTKTDALFIASKRYGAQRITVRTLQRWIKEIAEENDLDTDISPHSFRHGKAHHILNLPGGNIRDISAILRHSTLESSLHYLRMNEEEYLRTASKYLLV